MERGYRDAGRSILGGADFDDYRSYGRSGRSGYLDYEPLMRDSYLGSPGSSRSGRNSYGTGSSSYDLERADILDSLLQQRALQQQLSLRESQLALASSLLHQHQQQEFLSKRGMSPRGRDLRQDFKRSHLMDVYPRPRSRSAGGPDLRAGGRGIRGGASGQRNRRPLRWRGQLSSDRSKNKDKNDPEKPTADEDGEESKFRCKPCGVQCKDAEEMKKHVSSTGHKDCVVSTLNSKGDGKANVDGKKKPYCHICDMALNNIDFMSHQRLPFHKKRKNQVLMGCGWCKVTSFKNFTEVLKHRETEKHIKNQEMNGKRTGRKRPPRRVRQAIKVELPPELAKFDPKVVVGQNCVVGVTGWFCKLCNKFYNNENTAKETHCMTELHFNNYKKFMYTKLKAKAEAERDAREKAAEEEQKKKEAEEKKAEGDKEEPSSEQAEGDHEETADREGQEQEGGEAIEQNDVAEEEEADAEEEEAVVEGEEVAMEEEEGEEMIGEPEEYVDDEEAAAAEDAGLLEATEEPMEAEAEEEEEEEAAAQKTATRTTVSSPGRGQGGGGSAGRARRGRLAK